MSQASDRRPRPAQRERKASPAQRDREAGSAPTGFSFWIHVSPRARREGVAGRHGDALRVAVRAAPEAGRANAACVDALAAAFGVARGDVALDPRASGRRKRVRIEGDASLLERRFEALAKRD